MDIIGADSLWFRVGFSFRDIRFLFSLKAFSSQYTLDRGCRQRRYSMQMEFPVDSVHTDLSILGLLELLSSFDYCCFNFDRCSVVSSLGTGIRSKLLFTLKPFIEPSTALPKGTANCSR